MNKTLDHLPEQKQEELNKIASVIRDQCDDVEMIILFGSYARGDYKVDADLKPDRKSGHVSDYDILVVTGQKETVDNTRLWDEIAKACNTPKLSTHSRIIAHDIQELNIKLAEGQYFFSDIKKEGRVLFDSGKFELAEEGQLTPEEQQRIAQDHFDHWFDRVQSFYNGYIDAMARNDYKKAAFELHQTSESCYKNILLVFTNYNPNEHWLAALSDMVTEQDSSFDNIIPRDTKEEQDRFMLLDYAYIGARYDPKYRISKEDLESLAVHVKKLINLTQKICKQRIKKFTEKG
jgi:predicted nucleotidyltransferase/HEPN domain-containing protein